MFPNQNLTAYAGAGWLFHNSNYFARPDNTGRALFRYVAHADLDLYKNRIVLYGDMNFFTDREAGNTLNPSELDWIIGYGSEPVSGAGSTLRQAGACAKICCRSTPVLV
jgi:hypothetical protein